MQETHTFKAGDKVKKKSGKPFKCGFKTATVESLTTNPYSGHDAVVIAEDGTIVNTAMLMPSEPNR